MLQRRGWPVNHKRVERTRRRERLKVPDRQPRRGCLWVNDGSCIRFRRQGKGDVWAYDFCQGRRVVGQGVGEVNLGRSAQRMLLGEVHLPFGAHAMPAS